MASCSATDALDAPPGALFKHDPLDLGKKSIRLLRLLPTSADGIVECELRTEVFDDQNSCSYNALSYEWGPDEPPFHWIRVNGRYLLIRHSLYCFLLRASSRLDSRSTFAGQMWIDAVCIDQNNLAERGHQVKQMGMIYSLATTVLVWLGSGFPRSFMTGAHELLRWMQTGQLQGHFDVDALQMGKPEDNFYAHAPLERNSMAYSAFRNICQQRYWTRMWIIQEIYYASRALLITEEFIFPWEPVKHAMKNSTLDPWEVNAYPALQVVNYLTKDYTAYTLSDLVHAFGSGNCSDIRDRVYAILALLPHGEFPVDYSIHEAELFCSVVLVSYDSMTLKTYPGIKAESSTSMRPENLVGFKRKSADLVDLSCIIQVMRSLRVSFTALYAYLSENPAIGLNTLVRLTTTRVVEKVRATFTVHSFHIGKSPHVQPMVIYLGIFKQRTGGGHQPRGQCKIVQQRKLKSLGTIEQSETVTFIVESPFAGSWHSDGNSLWLPFETLIFILRKLHAINNLNNLTKFKLKEIASTHEAFTLSGAEDDKWQFRVTSGDMLFDLKF